MWHWWGLRADRPGTAWIGSVRFQISADEKCWSCVHRQELLTRSQRHAFRTNEREEGERMASFSLFLILHKRVRGGINAERRRTERQKDRPEGKERDSCRSKWGGVCSSVACLRGCSEMLSNTMEQVLCGVRFHRGGRQRQGRGYWHSGLTKLLREHCFYKGKCVDGIYLNKKKRIKAELIFLWWTGFNSLCILGLFFPHWKQMKASFFFRIAFV